MLHNTRPSIQRPVGNRLRRWPFLIAITCVWVLPSGAIADQTRITLENRHLRVDFSAANGCLLRLHNKSADIELIGDPTVERPWALLLSPLRIVSDFDRFQVTDESSDQESKLRFRWETPYDITVTVQAVLPSGSDQLLLTCAAENQGEETILALRYPDIQGIGRLSQSGTADRLLHSTMMGAVFDNPMDLFQHDAATPQGRGMVVSRYPNGFHGSAMQLMAYYVRGQGGFYFGVHDSQSTDKDLNFFKASEKSLSCEIAHFNWNARPGESLTLEYPVVIANMTNGDWYEAAERYRRWAVRQPWCRRGTRRQRVAGNDSARWLTEEVGTVGAWWPFRADLQSAIERTREFYGAPLLHLELWWQHRPSLESAQQQGDRFGPFYFPYLAQRNKPTFDRHQGDLIEPPGFSISPDWAIMCCAQQAWRKTFVESAVDMVGSDKMRHHQIWVSENQVGCNADCLYYDIGPCAGIPTHCYAADHQHPPGAGRQITDAHRSLIRASQRAATRAKGSYVPIGTECISEPFVGCIDFYYPRNAGFGLDMELLPYVRQLTWLPDGKMEVVPLFPYVYHQHGPVAIQGVYSADSWSSAEAIDINTWAEARAYLWGGLCATFIVPENLKISDQRQRFLNSLVAARTGFAKDFLAYGEMQRPPLFDCRQIELDHGLGESGWLRKIRFGQQPAGLGDVLDLANDSSVAQSADAEEKSELSVEQWVRDMLKLGATPAESDSVTVESVISAAYTLDQERLGLLFVNLEAEEHQQIEFELDLSQYGMAGQDYQLVIRKLESTMETGAAALQQTIMLDLPPREVILLEVAKSPPSN